MSKRNSRTISLVGGENFNKLANARIAVVGVGGVGGIACEMLARSGVKNLKIIDFDKYEESNLNRQIGSSYSSIGKLKVDVLKERFKDINPDLNLICMPCMLEESNYEELLADSDYILDLCDDINAKKLIAEYAIKNKIKFISAMGAGNRTDISRLKFSTLDKTTYCNLAKRFRKSIDKSLHKKIKCLYYQGDNIKVDGVVGTIAPSPNYMGVRAAAELMNMIMEEECK